MSQKAIAVLAALMVAGFAASAAAARAETLAPVNHASWTDADAPARLAPGDQVAVTVHSAPELSRTLTIGPDGRIILPMARPVMAANKTTDELTAALVEAYRGRLREPMVDVYPTFGTRRVFVGGEVARPGVYDIPAQMDALQAVIAAGGFTRDGRRDSVVLMRRAPGGQQHAMAMNLDVQAMTEGRTDAPAIAAMDVIYVPKKPIAQLNLFVQQYVREALPIQFSAYYDVSGANRR